jgi:hypothetical protein
MHTPPTAGTIGSSRSGLSAAAHGLLFRHDVETASRVERAARGALTGPLTNAGLIGFARDVMRDRECFAACACAGSPIFKESPTC